MKAVHIHVLNAAGEDTMLGVIIWDGKKLTAAPDIESLNRIIVECTSGPEQWLDGLHRKYRSPYLRATKSSAEATREPEPR